MNKLITQVAWILAGGLLLGGCASAPSTSDEAVAAAKSFPGNGANDVYADMSPAADPSHDGHAQPPAEPSADDGSDYAEINEPGDADPGEDDGEPPVILTTAAAIVKMGSVTFSIKNLVVAPGTTVTFKNTSTRTHTVTDNPTTGAKKFDRVVNVGKTFTFKFNKVGTYKYFCRYHGGMTARITVKEVTGT